MIIFDKSQTILEIGKVRIGGQPGELPTVLCGSIFYHKHKIVKDPIQGIFDKREAERLINQQDEWSDKTGNPCMVDVVGESGKALAKYVEFVASITDSPILLNGSTASVRVEAARIIAEIGLQDRTVYTSINYTVRENELKSIKELGFRAVLIQTFNPKNLKPEGSLTMLLGNGNRKGLLFLAQEYGVTKPLLLPPVLDIPSIGTATRAVYLLKERVGLPTGIAPCGVIGYWRRARKEGTLFKRICSAGILGLVKAYGADFIIYGAIRKAPYVFPVVAVIDSAIAYNARVYGIRPLTRNHPIYKYIPS